MLTVGSGQSGTVGRDAGLGEDADDSNHDAVVHDVADDGHDDIRDAESEAALAGVQDQQDDAGVDDDETYLDGR